jgi:hypothetical protein
MTVYLWHLTVMVLLIGVAMKFGGIGLGAEPGSIAWFLLRLVWIAVLFSVLQIFVVVLGRYEQPLARKGSVMLATWRVVIGTTLLSMALAFLALGGIGAEGPIGFRYEVVLVAFVGAFLLLPRWPFRRHDT